MSYEEIVLSPAEAKAVADMVAFREKIHEQTRNESTTATSQSVAVRRYGDGQGFDVIERTIISPSPKPESD